MQNAVYCTPVGLYRLAYGFNVSRVGDIKFKNGRLLRKFAGGALREREATTCAREHYLRPLFLGKFCYAKSQRCIGEHTSDDNSFSCENSHALDRSSPVLEEVDLKVLVGALRV